jgi:hypothetical protein
MSVRFEFLRPANKMSVFCIVAPSTLAEIYRRLKVLATSIFRVMIRASIVLTIKTASIIEI